MRRRLLIIVPLLLVMVGGYIFIRSVLNADVLSGIAEARLSAVLGQPVSIGSVRVSLLPVPAVVGSDISVGPQGDAPELSLERVRIVPRLRSLVRGPYVIRDITLEGLAVRIIREPSGGWRLPAVVPAPGGDASSGVIVERVRLRAGQVRVFELTLRDGLKETSRIEAIEGEATADATGVRVSPIRGRVGGAEITGEASVSPQAARFGFALREIKGEDLDNVLGLAASEPPGFLSLPRPASTSMSIRIDRRNSRMTGTGSLVAPEIGFYSLRLQGFEAPIKTDGARIAFAPATFALYGGTHRGAMVVDLSRTPARWSLESTVTGVDVGDFLAAMTEHEQRIDGTTSATATLRAGVGDPMPNGLEGRMHVTVVNGVISQFPLLAAINRALRLAEGDTRDTRFEKLSATMALGGSGYATTDDLVLLARDLRVEAAGRIGFDRSLDLAGLAVLSPDRAAEAIRSVRELSGLRNDRGELELPIRVSGTLDDPSFGIDLKAAVGKSIKEELRRRIRNLFRRDPGG
jgi:hypothetical protein